MILAWLVYYQGQKTWSQTSQRKEGYHIMIKGLIHQEIMTIINMYVSSIGASQHIKKILTHMKGKCRNKIMVRNINTQLSTLYRPLDRISIRKHQTWTHTWYQMNLTDIYSTFHSTAAKFPFFLSTHRTFPRVHHMLSHKTSLQKSKKTEIISSIISNHNGMKLKFSIRKNDWKFKNT